MSWIITTLITRVTKQGLHADKSADNVFYEDKFTFHASLRTLHSHGTVKLP